MHIQWCLKGIPEYQRFSDVAAVRLLSDGIASSALHTAAKSPVMPGYGDAHSALNGKALDDHVNNYAVVGHTTPYISLSAGVVLPSPIGGITVLPAWQTAAEFATRSGTCAGYIFRCWCIVSPKSVPEIAGVAEEVRNLNIFRQFWIFQDEGEIAAKLIVPARQIECVHKIDASLRPSNFSGRGKSRIDNTGFVPPDRLSNLLEVIV
jgi:hypothetical protein